MSLRVFVCAVSAFISSHGAWHDGDLGVSNLGTTVATLPLPSNASADCYAACLARADCRAWQVRFATPACGAAASCELKSDFGGAGANTYLGAAVPCALDACAASGPVARAGAPPLQPLAFAPARLSDVAPAGWLADALEVQAHRADEGIVVELLRPTARLALRDRSMCLRTLAGPGRRGRQPVPRRAPRAAWPKPAAMTASWSFPPT